MREELPNGQTMSSSPRQIVMQYAALGVRVDTNGPGALAGEAMIRLAILTGVMLGAHLLAALLVMRGTSARSIALAMGACVVTAVILGWKHPPGRSGPPGNGSLPTPAPARHKRAPENR